MRYMYLNGSEVFNQNAHVNSNQMSACKKIPFYVGSWAALREMDKVKINFIQNQDFYVTKCWMCVLFATRNSMIHGEGELKYL